MVEFEILVVGRVHDGETKEQIVFWTFQTTAIQHTYHELYSHSRVVIMQYW